MPSVCVSMKSSRALVIATSITFEPELSVLPAEAGCFHCANDSELQSPNKPKSGAGVDDVTWLM